MSEALNQEPLLRALHAAGVRYIIIGGFAVNAHGVIRPSKDLDIVPDPDPANLARLATLLADLDARFARAEQHLLAGLGPEDQAAFRKLLGALAARVNDLDPVLTACEAVEDITAR